MCAYNIFFKLNISYFFYYPLDLNQVQFLMFAYSFKMKPFTYYYLNPLVFAHFLEFLEIAIVNLNNANLIPY